MTEPAWMVTAREYIGLREIPGPEHNRTIGLWLARLKAWWRDDETPWCGAFVGHCVQTAGLEVPAAWYRARAWANYGVPTDPGMGAILVFSRQGGGHVGFYAGEDKQAFRVLGGNQSDGVSVTRILKLRLLAARWPAGVPLSASRRIVGVEGSLSTNEA